MTWNSLDIDFLFECFEVGIDRIDENFFLSYEKDFEQMDFRELIRWRFFISGIELLMKDGDKESLTQEGLWLKSIKEKKLYSLIEKLDLAIIEGKRDVHLKTSQSMVSWVPNTSNFYNSENALNMAYWNLNMLNFYQFEASAATWMPNESTMCCNPKTPAGMVKWMPNAFNTCYISNVERFRRELVKSFPMIFNQGSSQEDAYDFLVCVMSDILNFKTTEKDDPKFYAQHVYKLKEGTQLPCISSEGCLNSTFIGEPLSVLNLRLDSQSAQTLKISDLLTKERQTDEIEYLENLSKVCVKAALTAQDNSEGWKRSRNATPSLYHFQEIKSHFSA